MELRAGLLPPVVTDGQREEMEREVGRIEELLWNRDPAATAAVEALNARTGHDCGPCDFLAYAGSRSRADFALELARPARPQVDGITREELVELVRRALGPGPDAEWYLLVLAANVAHPQVGNVLFHGPDDAAPEQLVAELLAYRPIAL
ncbi:hypothetical protein AB0O31_14875 [Kitasatospora cineracea]|uniref:hypothetical protein n=1 Tax=Kitasatospora cineracea TaxID=88074 RepID=UPI003422F2EB